MVKQKRKSVYVKIPASRRTRSIPDLDFKPAFLSLMNFFLSSLSYATSLDLVATGKINVKPLITHHYTLEQTLEAFETAKTGTGNPIKVMIHANPNWKP